LNQQTEALDTRATAFLPDRILAAAFLHDDQALVLTAHNVLHVLHLSTLAIAESIACTEQPLLWSAAFSRLHYDDLKAVKSACGAIMQEIIVWSPFASRTPQRLFTGHNVRRPVLRHAFEHHSRARYTTSAFPRAARSSLALRTIELCAYGQWPRRPSQESFGVMKVAYGEQYGWTKIVWRRLARWVLLVQTCWRAHSAQDASILVWNPMRNLKTPVETFRMAHDGRSIWSLAFCKGHLASGGADGAVRLWSTEAAAISRCEPVVHVCTAMNGCCRSSRFWDARSVHDRG
jgi:hypothetical protein